MLQRLIPYMTVVVIFTAVYTAWTMYSRHAELEEAAQRAGQKTKQQEIASGKLAESVLNGGLKILSFAADTGVVAPGGRVLLCYGVANAARVTIEPHIKPVKPAISYCLEAHPQKTTAYKLTASDDGGHSVSASLTIHVDASPAAP